MKKKMKTSDILNTVCQVARHCDYTVYAVGGFVRDHLLGHNVKDMDFVVLGDALAFGACLKKELPLKQIMQYEQFGTFMAQIGEYKLEFTGARSEAYQPDSRKPHIKPAGLIEDLKRRDFTINAMAMDISDEQFGEILDPLDGQRDLKDRIVRTPLDALATFKDDPLRMMRACRFAAGLDFTMEANTLAAINAMKDRLTIVSQERISEEFNKILLLDKPSAGLKLLDATGLLDHFLPEITAMKGTEQRGRYHHKDVFNHTLQVLDNVAEKGAGLKLRLAALFHDVAKPRTRDFDEETGWTFHGHEIVGKRMTRGILKRLRYSSEVIDYVIKMVRLHLRPMALVDEEVTDSAIRRLIFLAGEDIDDLMQLCRADITSKNPDRVRRYLNNYDKVIRKMNEVEERDRLRNFQPPVDGNEIMQMLNLEPGPKVGEIKKFVEEAILDGRVPNEHDACVQLILENKEELLS